VLWLGSTAFFVLGIVLVLLGVHQAEMTADLSLDLAAFGLLGSLLALGFGIGLIAVGPLIDRVPRRPLFGAACALAGLALITIDDRSGPARLAWHLLLVGLGGGCNLTLLNAAVLDRYRERAAPALALMHAATTAGAASGPWLIATGQALLGLRWQGTFQALGALFLGLALLGSFTRWLGAQPAAAGRNVDPQPQPPRRRLSPDMLALSLVGFAYVGTENGLTLFAVPWAEGQGLPVATGRSAISVFWLGLMVGRLLLVARPPAPAASLLIGSGSAGALVVCLAAWWSWSPVVALGAAGLALGPVYPLMIALTGRHFPGAGTALGGVAAAGACGGFVLPWIGGVVGDAFEARHAIALFGAGSSLIALAALALARKPARHPARSS